MFLAFLKGLYLGLGLVMPLGPLNLYIFNNSSLQKRFISVLPVVVVSSICDNSVVIAAVCGVNVIADIAWFKTALMGVGAVFLLSMGIKMWRLPTRVALGSASAMPMTKQIIYSITLSLFNPHTILDTFVVIGAVSATYVGYDKYAFTFGCMFSDSAWFLFLALSGYFLHKVNNGQKIFTFIDKVSAAIMIFLGLQLVIDLATQLLD